MAQILKYTMSVVVGLLRAVFSLPTKQDIIRFAFTSSAVGFAMVAYYNKVIDDYHKDIQEKKILRIELYQLKALRANDRKELDSLRHEIKQLKSLRAEVDKLRTTVDDCVNKEDFAGLLEDHQALDRNMQRLLDWMDNQQEAAMKARDDIRDVRMDMLDFLESLKHREAR
ncbi:hypothetical protein B0J14DRAFT_555368 [Halenospora varia]|nr:hypothetical protein B0J14DRAFT_555368 [Halenospora varia]